MANLDIDAAYQLIPIHLEDCPLLAVQLKGDIFCDGTLPFGLQSAPKMFNAITNVLEWCAMQQGASSVEHYLDHCIVLGPPLPASVRWTSKP